MLVSIASQLSTGIKSRLQEQPHVFSMFGTAFLQRQHNVFEALIGYYPISFS